MTSKEKFEKWINENVVDPNLLIARNTEHAGKYQSAFMEQRWEVWQAAQADQAETIAQLQAQIEIMQEALENLAKLGNYPLYGTSEGNIIAKIALVRAGRVVDE